MADDADFEWALAFVLKAEGGYVNNPNDPGGETNFGVTQAVYTSWLHAQTPQPPYDPSVRHIPMEAVRTIYRTRYWDTSGCADLPRKLALVVFDTAVNSGPARSRLLLSGARQELDAGGSDVTLDLVRNEDEIFLNYLDDREEYFQSLAARHPRQRVFLKGWLRRLEALAEYAQLDWSL